MSRMISRDPFARTELHRESIDGLGQKCSWCDSDRPDGKMYVYFTERDGLRTNRRTHNGQFCCKSCHDSYHS